MEQPNETQAKILRIIATNPLGMYQGKLASLLDFTPTGVNKHLQPLIENKLLMEYNEGGKTQYLKLTAKGEYYTSRYVDIPYEELIKNHPYLDNADSKMEMERLKRAIPDKKFLDLYLKTIIDYSIRNDLFDQNGDYLLDSKRYGVRYRHYLDPLVVEITFKFIEELGRIYPDYAVTIDNADKFRKHIHLDKWLENAKRYGVESKVLQAFALAY